MSIGINDTFKFGKFKGKTFAEVMLRPDGPDYCCWLRESSKTQGKPQSFSIEANGVIDEAIRTSISLSKKYEPWNKTESDIAAIIKKQVAQREKVEAAEDEMLESRRAAYGANWGAFA